MWHDLQLAPTSLKAGCISSTVVAVCATVFRSIAYPVEAKRLDIIANFMTPAQVSFENVRTTELTAMLIQLVASERGVAALPDWVVAEYEKKGWVVSRKLGAGVHCQLYAATRTSSQDTAYMQGFAN